MRKTLLLLLALFTSLLLFGCNGKDQKVELPNLINSNKVQVLEKMENLGLEVNLLDEVNNKVQEGLFSSFGNNLKVGDEVEKGSKVDVYFAIHKNTLPNLTGLTKDEAAREFNYVRFIYTIVEVDAEFITIPVKSNGLSIQWASSNDEVARIFVDKIIITPSGQEETIFLTAKIGLHGYYDYRIFKFNVKGDLTVEAFVDVKFEIDGVQVLAPKYLTQYTITFDTQSGSTIEPVMQYYYTTIDVTSWTPTRDGYTFAGWAQPIPSRITEDITLVATWTAA